MLTSRLVLTLTPSSSSHNFILKTLAAMRSASFSVSPGATAAKAKTPLPIDEIISLSTVTDADRTRCRMTVWVEVDQSFFPSPRVSFTLPVGYWNARTLHICNLWVFSPLKNLCVFRNISWIIERVRVKLFVCICCSVAGSALVPTLPCNLSLTFRYRRFATAFYYQGSCRSLGQLTRLQDTILTLSLDFKLWAYLTEMYHKCTFSQSSHTGKGSPTGNKRIWIPVMWEEASSNLCYITRTMPGTYAQ